MDPTKAWLLGPCPQDGMGTRMGTGMGWRWDGDVAPDVSASFGNVCCARGQLPWRGSSTHNESTAAAALCCLLALQSPAAPGKVPQPVDEAENKQCGEMPVVASVILFFGCGYHPSAHGVHFGAALHPPRSAPVLPTIPTAMFPSPAPKQSVLCALTVS